MQKKLQINEDCNAVSAVIGVTLMVAVTIAMAAVGYAYLTGMFGGTTEAAPVIDMTVDYDKHTLLLTYKDIEFTWENIRVIASAGTQSETVDLAAYGLTGTATVGQKIDIDDATNDPLVVGTVRVTITHIPSNTMMSDFTFEDVT